MELFWSAWAASEEGPGQRDFLKVVLLITSRQPVEPKALCITLFSRSLGAASGRGHVATVPQLAHGGSDRHELSWS